MIYKPTINSMLVKLNKNKLKLRAITETNNYINVSHQLEVETKRFEDSLKRINPNGDDSIIESNINQDCKVFYMTMLLLKDVARISKELIIDIHRIVSTRTITPDQADKLLGLMLTVYFYLLFKEKLAEKRLELTIIAKDFIRAIDMNKYDIK